MIRSTMKVDLKADVKTVWDIVTDNHNTAWRSDLAGTEVLDNGNDFIERSKGGIVTRFHITKLQPTERYEFNLENKRIQGFWSGCFSSLEQGGTRLELAENIRIKNCVLRVLLEPMMNLEKMQATYIHDLKKRLGEL